MSLYIILRRTLKMLHQESNVKNIEFEKKLVPKNKTIKKLEKKNNNILKQLEAEVREDAKDDKISESEEAAIKDRFSVEDQVKASEGKNDDLDIVDENRNTEPKTNVKFQKKTAALFVPRKSQNMNQNFSKM